MARRARVKTPKPLRIGTTLELVDVEAQRAAEQARDLTVAVVRRNLPARSHRLERSIGRGRVSRTRTGFSITVQPSKSVRYPGGRLQRSSEGGVSAREVARFVEGGTGIYRNGRPIRRRNGKPFLLPNGVHVKAIRGQRAQRPFARAQTSTEALVFRTLERGAERLADRIEKAL